MISKEYTVKQTELGVIPADWKVVKFSDTLQDELRNGLTKPSSIRGNGIKMVNMGELFRHDRIKHAEMERVPLSESERKTYLLETGDLLFARQSLQLSGVGKCSIFIEDKEDVTFEGHLIRARLNKRKANPAFYYYFFKSSVGRKVIEAYAEQVAAAGIRGSDLKNAHVPLPSLAEQIAIGNILNVIDGKIEVNENMNCSFEAVGEALFKRWFVDFEFPNQEGKPYKSTGGKMKYDDELGLEIPDTFKSGTIYDLCAIVYGFPFSSKYFNSKQEGKPLIRIRDLKTLNPDFFTTEEDPRMTLIKPGDIIAGMDAEFTPWIWLGESAYLNQRLCMFKPSSEKNVHEFLIYQIVKPLLKREERAKVGTTVIHLAKSDIDRWRVTIPNDETLTSFSKLIKPFFERLVVNSQQIRVLTQLRDSLLPKLMSGKIRVPINKENVEAT